MIERKSLSNLEFEKTLALIASFASSNAAKDLIKEIFPSSDIREIRNKLDEVAESCALGNSGGRIRTEGIRDIRDLFPILSSTSEILSESDLLRVKANIDCAAHLKGSFSTDRVMQSRFPLLCAKSSLIPDLASLSERIAGTVSEKGEIRDDASPELKRIRRALSGTRETIEKQLTELVNSNSQIFQDRYFTIRNDRYVVPVIASSQSQIQGIVHDQSASGHTVFIEPIRFLELNNRIAQLRAAQREEILRILRNMTNMLKSVQNELKDLFRILTEFDVLNAKTGFAKKYDCSNPILTDEWRFSMKEARHPLLHPDCVPVSLQMSASQSCIVITGPNGGGKTVALKTAGINALLVQCGCFPLADEGSEFFVFADILADIGESQSIEDHLSTFTSRLIRLRDILAASGAATMVLIDEIGAGTDPDEGAALAYGILKEIRKRGAFSIVTSHFEALKRMAFTTPGFVNAGMEFDYKDFRPTFRMMLGVPGKSNALAVARRFGLPEEVLSELSGRCSNEEHKERDLIEAIERERSRAEALRRSWAEKCRQIDRKQVEVDNTMAQLAEFRKKRRDVVSEQFIGELREYRRGLEGMIHDLKSLIENPAKDAESLHAGLNKARNALKSVKKEINRLESIDDADETTAQGSLNTARRLKRCAGKLPTGASAKNPGLGDMVSWSGTNVTGKLISVDQSGKHGVMESNGKTVTVKLKDLQFLRKGEVEENLPTTSHAVGIVAHPPASEIDLRGMRVEEALESVEHYLKMASTNGLERVFLIHGKGTGALQRAIHEFLKKSGYAKRFRFGRYGEGDLGVTVVVFDPAADVANDPSTVR